MEGEFELFGLKALARPLNLSDLDPDDEAVLKSGVFQILSERDRTGRAVICDFQMIIRRCYKKTINLVRDLLEGVVALLQPNTKKNSLSLRCSCSTAPSHFLLDVGGHGR
jgi:hypothetical protein